MTLPPPRQWPESPIFEELKTGATCDNGEREREIVHVE